MNILFVSHAYYPSIGGIETMSRLLATGFARAGHAVHVVTQTALGEAQEDRSLPITRQPSPQQLWRLFRWSDIVVHSNITLRGVWPFLLCHRPWVIIHHTWIHHKKKALLGRFLKSIALRAGHSVCVSDALARSLAVSSTVIPNCYDDEVFGYRNGTQRTEDLLFVGRLVPDKGADLLLSALADLRQQGVRPGLTLVGSGPGETHLRDTARELGLGEQVRFAGSKNAPEVARLMRGHRVLVIPSRWNEPFGVVALEGIAAGCYVIGSAGGGLSEAIGPAGATVPNGNPEALTEAIATALQNPNPVEAETVERHLRRHHPSVVIARYLSLLSQIAEHKAAAVV